MIEWTIPAMSCGHCAGVITRTVEAADPAAKLDIDLPSRRVRVLTTADAQALAAALADAGYPPQPAG